jgi:hypothetical protein
MADDSNVDFYFDPTCGWAWRTSIWMRRVAAARGLTITWKLFSLAVVNQPDDYSKDSPGHVLGVPMERTLVLAERTCGNDAVDKLYVAIGNVYHGDIKRREILEPGTSTAYQRVMKPWPCGTSSGPRYASRICSS